MKKSEAQKSYHCLVEQIQQKIMNSELKVGDQLPPEREMSEIYNISRNSVREALRVLEVTGLIECRHGKGNFIANRLDGCVINALSAMFVLKRGKKSELLQMRRIIESGSICNIIERKRKKDVRLLRKIIADYEKKSNIDAYLGMNERFHKTIVSLSGNMLYEIVFNMLSALILPDMRRTVEISLETDVKNTLHLEHLDLLEAIEAGNQLRADKILGKHLLLDNDALAALGPLTISDLSFLQDRIYF